MITVTSIHIEFDSITAPTSKTRHVTTQRMLPDLQRHIIPHIYMNISCRMLQDVQLEIQVTLIKKNSETYRFGKRQQVPFSERE